METQQNYQSTEALNKLLMAHNIKPTNQRLEIARLLFTKHAHYAAEDIYSQVNLGNGKGNNGGQDNASRNSVSKATVYNTLGLFAKKGLVREVVADPNRIFYDPNTAPHYHFYDPDAGTLTDIDATDVQISGLPAAPFGRKVEGVDVVVRLRPE